MLRVSGALITLLTALTFLVADLPSRGAAALTMPVQTAIQQRLLEEVKVCKPCRTLCRKGYVCKCDRCVRVGRQCRPQKIMCKKGYLYKCNRCVRNKR